MQPTRAALEERRSIMSTDKMEIEVDDDMEPEMRAVLKVIGTAIGKDMPEGFGFALLLYHTEPMASYYVGSGDRKTLIKVLRQFIKEHETN
jgi:hypothetical protein